MVNILDIAKYVVWFGQECGDPVTHLKLQKICFYIEAFHLAIHDKPLTGESFEAWPHGPVSPRVYARYKSNGWTPILEAQEKPALAKEIEEHVKDVLDVYFQYGAYALEQLTHSEEPWKAARRGLLPDERSQAKIDQELMRTHYKQFLKQ